MAAAILLFLFQGAGRAPKRSGDLVQRGRKNKALRGSLHQVRAGRAPKRSGALVQRGRKNKVLRGFVHQARAGRAPKRSGDLVQRERKNKALRGSVHQVRAGRAPKSPRDLVQRGRKNKVLLGFVHQVRAGRALKRSGDLVQRGRKNKVLLGFVHQVRAGRAPKRSEDLVQKGRKNKGLRGFVHQPRAEKTGKGGPGTAHVGAPLPAKPCISVARRQHFALERCRSPAELAPRCRQSLVPPLRGANILPWSATGHRPSWRSITGKALCLRYGAPTFYPEDRPGIAHVGALLPAKPCASVARRQHFALEHSRSPAELAPHCRQSLVPSLRGANILPWSAAGHRPCWRPLAGKTLCLRYGAPTFYPEARPGIAHVGARLPAKPCASVARRQHFALERSRSPAELAPFCPQSLVPPLQGANILPWSAAGNRPSWRPVAAHPPAGKNNKKTSNLSCSSMVRDQGFEPWTP